MNTQNRLLSVCVIAALGGLGIGSSVPAPETPTTDKPMTKNAPMAGKMKKPGAKTDDVRTYERKWEEKMKTMLDKEQQTMDEERAKKQPVH